MDCLRHGRVEFHHVYAGGGLKRWRCKRCVGESVTRRKQKIRRILIQEAGGRCVRCGYDRCVFNLSFHHRDPATKSFPMSAATGRSLAAFREEAKKCILLCATCHAEVEAELLLERGRRAPRLQPGNKPTELRRCRIHGLAEHGLYGVKQPRWRCKRCNVEVNLRRRRNARAELIRLAGGCCVVCGYATKEAALHFHHVDPTSKLFDLKAGCLRARARVVAELAKCVLVCANCHGEIETGQISCPSRGEISTGVVGKAVQPTVA